MAKDRPAAAEPVVPPVGRGARLRAWLAGLAGLLALVRRYPLRSGIAALACVAASIGIAVVSTLMLRPPDADARAAQLQTALARLDAGDLNQARQLAAELHRQKSLTFAERGGPLFVQGAVTFAEAQQQLDPAKRRFLYLIAGRYLEEARSHGLPQGRAAQAHSLLGEALHHSGRHADSLPMLGQALGADPAAASRLLPLMTESCRRLTPPRLDQALTHNAEYLALESLEPADRHAAQLVRSRILLDQGQHNEAWQAASALPPDAAEYPQALVVQGQIAVATWAAKKPLSFAPELTAPKLAHDLRQLVEQQQLTPETAAQIELLIGLALEQVPDLAAAAAQFDRVHTTYFGRPEATAAAVYQAGLLLGSRPADAVALLRRALAPAETGEIQDNPWLPQPDLHERVEHALDQLLAAGRFSLALELATALTPALSATTALQGKLRTHRHWAAHLERQAGAQRLADAEVTRAEARQQWREAGLAGWQLAELRIVTRQYSDDLRGSAADFLRGQGYRQAARVYERLLAEEAGDRRPEALLGLGDAQLALGQPELALQTLRGCVENFPRHPASYRARLLASQAELEAGHRQRAKELLLDNLYRHALTPQSNDWRDSLFAYGFLLYGEGLALETQSRQAGIDQPDLDTKKAGLAFLEQCHAAFHEAARVLTEAVERYPTVEDAIRARYAIAESYRHSAKWPRKRLGTITIETTRLALNRQLQEELHASLEQYGLLIAELGDGQDADKSPTEAALLRNCYFGKADALFDLGRYEEAMQAYSAATNRYQHEPEALEAYVQIAACLRRLNRTAESRGTLEQARIVLQRLRPDADFTRTTRYTRDEWAQLLTWLRTL